MRPPRFGVRVVASAALVYGKQWRRELAAVVAYAIASRPTRPKKVALVVSLVEEKAT
jgi:hypothetical protein